MPRIFVSFQITEDAFRGFAWAAHAARAERARWLLWLPVGLGLGIGLYFAWPVEPKLWSGWAVAVVGLSVARAFGARGWSGPAFAMTLLAVGAVGFGLGGVRTWWVAAPALVQETGPITVQGQVVDLEPRPRGPRITLERLSIQRLAPGSVPQRIRISLSGGQPAMRPGDWVELTASLAPPPSPAAPGAFDFQRQSYFRGLGAVGFGYGRATLVDTPRLSGGRGLVFRFQRLRLALAERVRDHIPGDAGRVASALMTGERAAIPETVLEAMRASGLAHLLAISGLHVGLVAGIVFFAVRLGLAAVPPVALGWPVKKAAAMAAMASALGYALLAGWTVPTQRAFLMVSLVLVAVLVDRRALSMRSVALAAGAILCLSPEALLGASFQMSFAAVVALVAVYETLGDKGLLRPGGPWMRRVTLYVLGVAVTTAVAGAATALFAAFHFNRVADYGLAANLVAVPIMAMWIMPLAVTAFALMPLGLEALALAPMGWGVEVVLRVAETVSGWPGAQRLVPAFPVWGLGLAALGGLWLAIWQGPWRHWGVGVIACGVASFWAVTPPDVLIDATGRLAAVRTVEGGYAVSTLSTKRFERDVWLRRAGLGAPLGRWRAAELVHAGDATPGRVRCDALGCVYRYARGAGEALAFVHAPEALAEDCARAKVVVDLSATAHAMPCRAQWLITLDDLARDGAHALWVSKQGMRIESVNAWRGQRPWVLHGAGLGN